MISICQRLHGIKLFEHPTDIERLELYFYKEGPKEILVKDEPKKESIEQTIESIEQTIESIKQTIESTKEPIKQIIEKPIIRKQNKRRLPPDSLFWNIFIEIYGEGEFFQIGTKFTNREWEEKNKIRTAFMTNPKELQTTNQKITLGNIKEMMSEYMISTTTTLLGIVGLAVYYKMPIILVDLEKKINLPFLPVNTDREPFILIKNQGKGKAPDHYEVGDESVLKDTFGLASYLRPLRAISTYKRCELDEIAIQTGLADDLSGKKSKDEVYRSLSEQLVWK